MQATGPAVLIGDASCLSFQARDVLSPTGYRGIGLTTGHRAEASCRRGGGRSLLAQREGTGPGAAAPKVFQDTRDTTS